DLIAIDFRRAKRMGPQRLEIGTEQETGRVAGALPAVVQGLLAQAVPTQSQDARLGIPDGEGEHADAALHRGPDAPRRETRQQRLGIRMPAPALAAARCQAGLLEVAAPGQTG